MLGSYGIRTDLALEATERFTEENVEIRGWRSVRTMMRRKMYGQQ